MTLATLRPNLSPEQALEQLEQLKLFCRLPVLAHDRLKSGDIDGAMLLLHIFPEHFNAAYFHLKLYLQRSANTQSFDGYSRTASAIETLRDIVAQLSDEDVNALITLAYGLLCSEHTQQAVKTVADEMNRYSNETWMGNPIDEEF